jgi:hypothetical protein
MVHDFDDFRTYVFVIVDDIIQGLAPVPKRPGPAPDYSDSELIAMTLVGECRGWDVETELLSNMQEHTDLFPCIPSQSRFNRRRRNLMFVINLIRRTILSWLDLAQDPTAPGSARCPPRNRPSSAISYICWSPWAA